MTTTIDVGPIYPPYQTDQFQKCPLLWHLSKNWARSGEKPRTAMLIGNAVARGLEAYFQGDTDELQQARTYVEDHYKPGSDRTFKGVSNMVEAGVQLGMNTQLSIQEVLAVEEYFGRVKPDLVGRDYDGSLAIWDHKVKTSLDERYIAKELLEYDTSNQF